MGWFTPIEVRTMLDGFWFANDREWERAIYLHASGKAAWDILARSFPRYKREAVVEVVSAVRENPRPKTFSGG